MNQTNDKQTILIVDDIAANIKTAAGTLVPNFKVLAATNGKDAIKSALTKSPDLILLDINMPDMDGYEVCRQLKSDPITQNIPVIFLTAESGVMDEAKGFMLGAVDYILKPINPPILKVRVNLQLLAVNHKTIEKKMQDRIMALENEVKELKKIIEKVGNNSLK